MTTATTLDALIENEKQLNAVIAKIRSLRVRGIEAPKSAARYLTYLRAVQTATEALGVEPRPPVPFSQFVGLPADKLFAANWRMDRRMFPARAPIQFLQAAE